MNLIKKSILFGTALLFSSFSAIAEIKVVTTIKPIHSLVSGVMDGVSNPTLIIEGSNSPHNFSLKPSHAKMLEEADIVFWIGEDIESFMEKPLNSLAKNAVQISFMDLKSIEKLKFREMNGHDDHHDPNDDGTGIKEAPGFCLFAMAITSIGCIVLFFHADKIVRLLEHVVKAAG